MKWTKTSERQPPDIGERYHVKVCTDGVIDYLAPMVLERFLGKWVLESEDMDNFHVVEWLDESPTSTDTGQPDAEPAIIVSGNSRNNLFEECIKPLLTERDGTEWDCLSNIDDYIREDVSKLLNKFFNHKSDANKYLTSTQQENLEAEFSNWINNPL